MSGKKPHLLSLCILENAIGFTVVPEFLYSTSSAVDAVSKYFGFKDAEEYINSYPGRFDTKNTKTAGLVWYHTPWSGNVDKIPENVFYNAYFTWLNCEPMGPKYPTQRVVKDLQRQFINELDADGKKENLSIVTVPLFIKDFQDLMTSNGNKEADVSELWFCLDWKE